MKKLVVCLLLIATQAVLSQPNPPHFKNSPWDTVILGSTIPLSNCTGNITILRGYLFAGGNCYTFAIDELPQQRPEDAVKYSVTVNPLLFDRTPQFKLVAHALGLPNHTLCFRLFDLTAGQPVIAPEICQFTPLGDPNVLDTGINTHSFRVVSAPFTLMNEEHLYTVQFNEFIANPLPIIIDQNGSPVGPQDDFSFGELNFVRLTAEPMP